MSRRVSAALLFLLLGAACPRSASDPPADAGSVTATALCGGDAGIPCCAELLPNVFSAPQAPLPFPVPIVAGPPDSDAGVDSFFGVDATWLAPRRLSQPVVQECSEGHVGVHPGPPCEADSVARFRSADGGIFETVVGVPFDELLRIDAGTAVTTTAGPGQSPYLGWNPPWLRRFYVFGGGSHLDLWTSVNDPRLRGDQDDGGRLPPFYLGPFVVRRSATPICRVEHRGCVYDAYAFDLGQGRLVAPGETGYENPDGGGARFIARAALKRLPQPGYPECPEPVGPEIYSFEVYDHW